MTLEGYGSRCLHRMLEVSSRKRTQPERRVCSLWRRQASRRCHLICAIRGSCACGTGWLEKPLCDLPAEVLVTVHFLRSLHRALNPLGGWIGVCILSRVGWWCRENARIAARRRVVASRVNCGLFVMVQHQNLPCLKHTHYARAKALAKARQTRAGIRFAVVHTKSVPDRGRRRESPETQAEQGLPRDAICTT